MVENSNLLFPLYWYFGIAYLILRWLPRYRINLMGTRCPLGKADWCVIENEFGELQIAHVEKQRFNERLSSFLVGTDDQFDFEKTLLSHIFNHLFIDTSNFSTIQWRTCSRRTQIGLMHVG